MCLKIFENHRSLSVARYYRGIRFLVIGKTIKLGNVFDS